MKKQDKVNLVLAGAGVLVALYAFMPKGERGPGSSGGLGAGLGGLPPGSGGGGADTPTVNIDFPALPPFTFDEPTKKEQNIAPPASAPAPTPTLPPWETDAMGSLLMGGGSGFGGGGAGGRSDTPIDPGIFGINSGRNTGLLKLLGNPFGLGLPSKKEILTEKASATSFGGTEYRAAAQGRFKMNLSPYVATKKEVRSGYGGGGGSGSYTGTVGGMPGGIPLNLSTGQSWLSSKGY